MPRAKRKQETQQESQEIQEQLQEAQGHEQEESREFGEGKPLELLRDDCVHSLELNPLLRLRDVGLLAEAQRDLSQEHINNLMGSDPLDWPPISVTKTSRGYLVTDGNHRIAAAMMMGLKELRAKSTTYHVVNDVIEAAFSANLEHGLPANQKTRSEYAYWLHRTYPDMLQMEIAQRTHLTQPSVSMVIQRRDREEYKRQAHEAALAQQQTQQVIPGAPVGESIKEQPVGRERAAAERERERVLKSCQSLVRQALRFWQENQETDESQLVHGLSVAVSSDEEREHLRSVISLLESSVRVGLKKPAGRRKR